MINAIILPAGRHEHTGPWKTGFSLFLLLFFTVSSLAQGYINVTDHGINPGNTEVFTEVLNTLIDETSAGGGGTIYFPSGEYLSGPIHMKSNITIHLDAGAVLRFSDNFDDYLPMVPSRFEGVDILNFSPLIYAWEAENITITGRGTIDGQGQAWWDFHHKLYRNPRPSKWQREFREMNRGMLMPDNPAMFERGFCRPPFIQPMYCKNVRIEGINIINSPFWTVNPEFCENVTIDGVTITNPPSPNTDGINPESCKNVHISNCHISVGDDCITIKSGKDIPGRTQHAPAENYTITNCTMLSGHGGVVIGSEMSGDVRNIVITNCIFDGTDRGIRIKSTRGRGGVVEDIRVSNVVMRDIRMEAIKLNLMYSRTDPEPVSERTPRFRDIHISNVTGTAAQAVAIIGLEEMPVENISFSDINLDVMKGVYVDHGRDISFSHVTIRNERGNAFDISNSAGLEWDGCNAVLPGDASCFIFLKNVQQAWIHGCSLYTPSAAFVAAEGESTSDITLHGNLIRGVEIPLKISDDIPADAIKYL